jgi:hypothetical protein
VDVLVNPVNKSNLTKLSDVDIAIMFDRYTILMGAAPAPESEPSSEQLSAVNQLIVGGKAPYVDFSIWTLWQKISEEIVNASKSLRSRTWSVESNRTNWPARLRLMVEMLERLQNHFAVVRCG